MTEAVCRETVFDRGRGGGERVRRGDCQGRGANVLLSSTATAVGTM